MIFTKHAHMCAKQRTADNVTSVVRCSFSGSFCFVVDSLAVRAMLQLIDRNINYMCLIMQQ